MQIRKSTIEFDSCSDLTEVFNAENLAILAKHAQAKAMAHLMSQWLDELEAAGISRADVLHGLAYAFPEDSKIHYALLDIALSLPGYSS